MGTRLFSTINRQNLSSVSLLHAGIGTTTAAESLRTRHQRWQTTVRELIRISHLVVIDARIMSANIMCEAEWMLQRDLTVKAVFVIGDDGEQPVIDAMRSAGIVPKAARLPTVKESDIGRVLYYLFSRPSQVNNYRGKHEAQHSGQTRSQRRVGRKKRRSSAR